ncbi:MAG TPA: hypothetical protein VKA38_00145, partial [Draconibacterium sp.]|nr:hypothetical protein [Draconibacterium sp.]
TLDKPKLDLYFWNFNIDFDIVVFTSRNFVFNHSFGRAFNFKNKIRNMKIFVLDFSESNEISNRISKEHSLAEEKIEGGKAYKTVAEFMPDKIFVNYKDKPSHGRQTVISIKNRKKTSEIEIYFVDGTKNENEKIKNIGKIIGLNEIRNYQ